MNYNRTSRVQGLLIIASLLGFLGLAFYMYSSRPQSIPEESVATEFSAERAYQHLEVIAQQPRRLYQPYYNECRDYFIRELEKLGLEVEIQESTAHHTSACVNYSSVENIITRIYGTSDSQDSILIDGHFDSEPFVSPGAQDDGSAVAIMLEIARALKSGEPLSNDVILLFSSAHEPGNMGATAFITEHPWAEDVKLAINLEGGGDGKAILLDTNPDNGWLIEQYAKAYQKSLSNSTVVYLRFPNTDFAEVFRPAGYSGFDINNVMGSPVKGHTRLDNLERIHLRDIQEYGNTVYALTRHFGNINLRDTKNGNGIFFSLLGLTTIQYPDYVPRILVAVAVVLFGFVLFLGFRKRIISLPGIGIGIAGVLLCVVATVAIINGVWYLITFFHPMYQYLYNSSYEYNSLFFYISFVIMAVIISYLSFFLVGKIRGLSHPDLVMGISTTFLLIALVTNIIFPGLDYFTVWIALALVIAIGYWFLTFKTSESRISTRHLIPFLAASLISIILLLPLVMFSFGSTPSDLMQYIPAVILIVAVMPVIFQIINRRKVVFLAVFGLAAIVPLAIALADDFRAENPRITHVSHLQDADGGRSFWITQKLYRSGLDDYSSQFVSDSQEIQSIRDYISDYPYDYEAYVTPVEAEMLPAPRLEVLEDSTTDGIRTLELHISTMRNAWEISAYKNPDLEVIEYKVNGVECKPLFGLHSSSADETSLFHFHNVPEWGLLVQLKVKAGIPVRIRLTDTTYGLPEVQGIDKMPDYIIPLIDWGADKTNVTKTYDLQ